MPKTLAPLADINDLATITGKSSTDPQLQLALKRAEGRFRLEAGHSVSRVENDEIRLSGTGNPVLLLPAANITDIEVTMLGGTVPLRELRDYSVGRRHGILRTAGGWPVGEENVLVRYTHGWDADSLPEGVSDAVLEHATTLALTLAHVAQESNGTRSMTLGTLATVGVTQKWANAVAAVRLEGRV